MAREYIDSLCFSQFRGDQRSEIKEKQLDLRVVFELLRIFFFMVAVVKRLTRATVTRICEGSIPSSHPKKSCRVHFIGRGFFFFRTVIRPASANLGIFPDTKFRTQ